MFSALRPGTTRNSSLTIGSNYSKKLLNQLLGEGQIIVASSPKVTDFLHLILETFEPKGAIFKWAIPWGQKDLPSRASAHAGS